MEDLTGKQFGLYQIHELIGEGGMATVFKAFQPSLNRYVALKVLPREFTPEPQSVSRFEREVKILAKLQHPNVLAIFDCGESEGYIYIVMPLVTGGTLTKLLHRKKPLASTLLLSILSQIGSSLEYVHSHGIVHRDLKPANVLVDEQGNCLLADFGIAKILDATTNLTTGFIGTPIYASPEQASGDIIDRRSDIYSLGIMLYEMVTGGVPFIADTPMAVLLKHVNDPLPSPRRRNPELSEEVERVIMRALAKRPGDRYATVGDMLTALRNAYAATPTFVADPSIDQKLSQEPQLESSSVERTSDLEIDPAVRTRLLTFLDQDKVCVSIWKAHRDHIAISHGLEWVDYAIKGNDIFGEVIIAWNAGYPLITIDDLITRIGTEIELDEWTNITGIAEDLCHPGKMNFLVFAGNAQYAINYPVIKTFLDSSDSQHWVEAYRELLAKSVLPLRKPEEGLESSWIDFLDTMVAIETMRSDCASSGNAKKAADAIAQATRGLELTEMAYEKRNGLYAILCCYAVEFHGMRGLGYYMEGNATAGGPDLQKALNFEPECYKSQEFRETLIKTLLY